jgi:hypothetical protein
MPKIEKKCLIFLILSLNFFCSIMHGVVDSDKLWAYFFSPALTDLPISDWCNPTIKDYQLIQAFIKEKVKRLADIPIASRPFENEFLNKDFHGWITYRMNQRDLVGNEVEAQLPHPYIIYFNKDPSNKKRCVICYASHHPANPEDRDYKRGIDTIVKALKQNKFDGHFIFYIGGWPGLKKGRLKYADVPYSFKPFMFEEVRDLGYEQVLWLDACTVPVNSLDPVFKWVETHGICYFGYGGCIPWDEFNRAYSQIIPFINIGEVYRNIVSQVVGINMRDSRGTQLLEAWIKAAEEKVPFLQSDQPPFGFLINKLNLLHGELPYYYMVETPSNTGDFAYWKLNPYAIFYHQYDFLDPKFSISYDFFEYRKIVLIHPFNV